MPFGMQRRKLAEFIVKHGYDPQVFDLDEHIDRTLSYRENRDNIAKILDIKRDRTNRKQIDHEYCGHLQEQCEIKCDNSSCKTYQKEGCQASMGKVEPCGISRKGSGEKKCPIPVRSYCVPEHTRKCPTRGSSAPKPGCRVQVKAYCVEDHTRKCR